MKVLDYDGLQYYDSLISSMYLKKSGGTMTGGLTIDQNGNTPLTLKTTASYNDIQVTDGTNRIGTLRFQKDTTNSLNKLLLGVIPYGTNNAPGGIEISRNGSGTITATAPTPTAGDNSTKIATTAFVNTKAGSYLPLAGGTLTGAVTTASNIVLDKSGTSPVVGTPIVLPVVYKTKTTASGNAVYDTAPFFVFPTSDTSNNGTGFGIQTGGALVIGSGESPRALVSALTLNGGTENAYLTADGTVYIVTNGNTIANRKTFAFTTDGKLQFPDGSTIWIA